LPNAHVEIWMVGCDLDAYMEAGGNLCDIGMPHSPEEHRRLAAWIASQPEEVLRPLLCRLDRFIFLVSEGWAHGEGQLRQCWAWSEPGLQ